MWRCVLNLRARKAHPDVNRIGSSEPMGANGGGPEPDGSCRDRTSRLCPSGNGSSSSSGTSPTSSTAIASALEIEVGTVGATLSAAHAALTLALEKVPA